MPNAISEPVAEDRADVTLTLIAEVARDYIDLRGAHAADRRSRARNLAI